MGVAEFNDACRTSVLRYTNEWREYVTRQARWVDFDNDYKTLDLDYMESVMWAFKTLWDKGLVYEGFRVLWYCWRCETPLSNTETKMDDVYRDRQDPAVTVGLRLRPPSPDLDGAYALIWTTTPWTLPSNLAVAVHPDVEYVVVEAPTRAQRYLLAEAARRPRYARELGEEPPRARRFTRRRAARDALRAAVRLLRRPPANAHQVLAADYVTTDDGTGHRAHRAGVRRGGQGRHRRGRHRARRRRWTRAASSTPRCRRTTGMHVFDANPQIIRDLRDGDGQGCCCATRPTSTRTRTAGAATTR